MNAFIGENLDSLELTHQIADILVEKQGEDILILDLQGLKTFTDYFIICSGTSRRQLDALQGAIRETLKQPAPPILPEGVEGTPESGWILMDYGGVIVHLFTAETRRYYQLEDLWKAGHVVARIQ